MRTGFKRTARTGHSLVLTGGYQRQVRVVLFVDVDDWTLFPLHHVRTQTRG
jgi:hypothetical protein